MKLKAAFLMYANEYPEERTETQRTLLALRRGGFQTIESLYIEYRDAKDDLADIRGIGPRSMWLIRDILQFCKAKTPPESGVNSREAVSHAESSLYQQQSSHLP